MNSQANERRKNRKDYLYKVGKLKENKMLNEKEDEEQPYCQEQQPEHRINLEEIQQQMDFQLVVPSFKPISDVNVQKTEAVLTTANNIFNVKSQSSCEEKPKIDSGKEEKASIKDIKQSIEEKQNVIKHKPITFEDFDQEISQAQPEDPQPVTEETQRSTQNQNQKNNGKKKQQQEQAESSSSCSEQEIKGVSITSNSLQGNVMIKITNKRELILSRLPPGIILKCIIRRSSDIFNPEFDFYLNNGLKHMISAKKYSLAKKEIFKLSLELGRYRDIDIIGSIMANLVHSSYWIYKQDFRNQEVQHQIKGVVKFQKLVKNKERQMVVDVFVDKNHEIKVESDKLAHEIYPQGGLKLKNSEPKSKQSSSKNYVLFDQQDNEYEYLKMNKVSDHMFQIEIQHPLSPFQAFAISLTRFDAELK